MNEMRYYLGKEGFVWFIGVVEDRMDPDQLGRVRVRCFGWHTDDKSLIPTNALPWAHSVHPNSVPASYAPKEGDWVVGFFADGNSAQHPYILGILPGAPSSKPDINKGYSDPSGKYPKYLNESSLSRLARNVSQGTVVETRKRNTTKSISTASGSTWSEPNPAFSPQYPFNFAIESESGHALELDDTTGKERVTLSHRNGNYVELDSQGNRTEKVIKDNYSVILGSDYVYIKGKCSITVDGDLDLKVGGTFNVVADAIHMAAAKNTKILGESGMKIESKSSMDIKAGGSLAMGSGGSMDISGGATTIQGSTVDVVAGLIDLQAASSASKPDGTGLSAKNASSKSGGSGGSVSSAGAPASGLSEASGGTSGGTNLGKSLLNTSTSVSSVYSNAQNTVFGGVSLLKSNASLGELTAGMASVEDSLNASAGQIVALPSDQLAKVRGGVDELSALASEKGVPVSLDSRLYTPEATVNMAKGKKLYPLTVSVPQEIKKG